MRKRITPVRQRGRVGRPWRAAFLNRRPTIVLALLVAMLPLTVTPATANPGGYTCTVTAVYDAEQNFSRYEDVSCVPRGGTEPVVVDLPAFRATDPIPLPLYNQFTPPLPAPTTPDGLELTAEDVDRLLAAAEAELTTTVCGPNGEQGYVTDQTAQGLVNGGYLAPGANPCDTPNPLRQQAEACLGGVGDLIRGVGQALAPNGLQSLLDFNLTLLPADQAVAPAVQNAKDFLRDPFNFKLAQQDPAAWLCQNVAALGTGKAIGAIGDQLAATNAARVIDDTAVLRTLTDDEAARVVGAGPVRRFGSDTIAAEQWAEPLWRDYLATLNKDQYTSLLYYKGWPTNPGATQWQTTPQTLSGYRRINDYLRTGQAPTDPAVPGIVANLDSAIAGAVVPETVEVFFGLRSADLFNRGAGNIGGVLDDAAFRSTTLSEEVAGGFALRDLSLRSSGSPVVVRTQIPAGSQGLYLDVDNIAIPQDWGLLRYLKAGEAEILLPRNSSIRITGAELKPGIGNTTVGGGVLYLDGELLLP